jgi:hypothetical protein
MTGTEPARLTPTGQPIQDFATSFIPAQELIGSASVITGVEFSQQSRCRQ